LDELASRLGLEEIRSFQDRTQHREQHQQQGGKQRSLEGDIVKVEEEKRIRMLRLQLSPEHAMPVRQLAIARSSHPFWNPDTVLQSDAQEVCKG
jgi:hypothetical protein